jgi:hypothetical protein
MDRGRESASAARRRAVKAYSKGANVSEAEAEDFYSSLVDALEPLIILSASEEDVHDVMSGKPFRASKRAYNLKDKVFEKAFGIKASPCRARVGPSRSCETDSFGLVLSPDPEASLVYNGGMGLQEESETPVFDDPRDCVFDVGHTRDCLASSLMSEMDVRDFSLGPEKALEAVLARPPGDVEVLVYGPVTRDDVLEVLSFSEDGARSIRKLLDRLGRLVPVSVANSSHSPAEEDCGADRDIPVSSLSPPARVAPKERLNNPSLRGSVVDSSDGRISVQWDNGFRYVYDLAEALSRLMVLEDSAEDFSGNAVVYSLPGMDDESVSALNAAGVDPVTVYSVASHSQPLSDVASGWEESLSRSYEQMGIPVRKTSGFVYQDEGDQDEGDYAFVPGEWFEGRLPGGGRLVVEVSPKKISVRAGNADDYVPAGKRIVFE